MAKRKRKFPASFVGETTHINRMGKAITLEVWESQCVGCMEPFTWQCLPGRFVAYIRCADCRASTPQGRRMRELWDARRAEGRVLWAGSRAPG